MNTFARLSLIGLAAALPVSALAAGTLNTAPITGIFDSIIEIINFLVPVVFAIAFIVFIWGVFQYFIAGGANEEKRKEGAQFVLWGIIGFVVMMSVWGIVNIGKTTLDIDSTNKTPTLPTFEKNN